jgi:imidazolonepropionase-like amidohydrolase
MAAICEEAHWANKRVAAHAHGGQGITDALRAGVDSFEHSPWLTDEQIATMVKQGAFYVPTLLVHSRGLELGPEGTNATAASRHWLAQVELARWDTLKRAKAAGVKIAVGTDAGFWVYHGESAKELEELVRGGFTPMEAIVAATRISAECLDMDQDVGTIEPGKYADLVLVDGDPLSDIRVLQDKARIVQVFKGGRKVK